MFKRIISLIILLSFVIAPVIASPLMMYGIGPTSPGVADSDSTNQAVQLTAASSQYLSRADDADYSFGDEDFSIAGWVYFDSVSSDRTVLGKLDMFGGGIGEYWLFLNGGSNEIKLWVYNSGGSIIGNVTEPTVIMTGTWYFIECGHNATSNEVWISINGGARTTAATSGVPFDGTSTFKIGANTTSNSELHDGRIDSVGIWKGRALSTTDRDSLYNSGSGLKYSQLTSGLKTSLVGWYDFANAQITTDGSGSANTLTNNNSATNTTGVTMS